MAAPVVHFEIHASDPARCRAFYEKTLGWATGDVPGMEGQYWMMYPNGRARQSRDEELPGPGIAGGMMIRQGPPPAEGAPVNGYVCVVEIPDLDRTYGAVKKNGGSIALEPMDIPNVGRVFYFKDTEGNIVGALQPAV